MYRGHPGLIRLGRLTDEPDHFTGLRVELDSWATAPVDLKQDLVPAGRHRQFESLAALDPGYLVVVQDHAVASEPIPPFCILARQQ